MKDRSNDKEAKLYKKIKYYQLELEETI